MGAFLEKPITDKTTEEGVGKGLRFGVSAMQGWRKEMEDKHVCNTKFSLVDHAFFGVFDGHAGTKASEYSAKHLLEHIMQTVDPNKPKSDPEVLKKAITNGFLTLDAKLKDEPGWLSGENRGGTTAVTVMITPDKIIFGNCGDSRGFLCRSDKVEFATLDHKPSNELERKRIEAAGGSVMMQRVNGSLAVSRAIGDFEFKMSEDRPPTEQLVSPEPEVTILDRDPENDQFLLLACDGVYDVMSNEEIVQYIKKKLLLTNDLKQISSDLIDLCLHKNSRDNMSVILITFEAAPRVSSEAIEKEKEMQKEAKSRITKIIQIMVNEASDPLELEEGEVMHQIKERIDIDDFEVFTQKPFIVDLLAEKKKAKFGDYTQSFDGQSDSSEAPDFLYRWKTADIYVGAEASDMEPQNRRKVPVVQEMEVDPPISPSTDNLPSPVQTDSTKSV